MSDITVKLNGNTVKANEKTLRVMAAVVNTQNPGTYTVTKAVELAGGQAYIKSFASTGKPGDMFEVTAISHPKSGDVTTIGKGDRQTIANKMHVALTSDTWQTAITRDGKAIKDASPDMEVELF